MDSSKYPSPNQVIDTRLIVDQLTASFDTFDRLAWPMKGIQNTIRRVHS